MRQIIGSINFTGAHDPHKAFPRKELKLGSIFIREISHSKFGAGAKFNVCAAVPHATEKSQSVLKSLLSINRGWCSSRSNNRVHSLNCSMPETASHIVDATRSAEDASASARVSASASQAIAPGCPVRSMAGGSR